MEITKWIASASSENFTYRAEAKRPWSPETVLEMLEQAHREFEKRMGTGLDTVIEVEDRICEPNNLGARAEINKQVHSEQAYTMDVKFICEFPPNYGQAPQERDLAYHFFVHELFHCWIGGHVSDDYGLIIEALTQYMTDWVLVCLGWCTEDLLMRERTNWQRIVDTPNSPHATLARYKLLFHQMRTNDPKTLLAFCRDLADCFRQQRNRAQTEIFPVLQRYLRTELEEY